METEYEARNRAILDQFEALNAKAIEVGHTVGIVALGASCFAIIAIVNL